MNESKLVAILVAIVTINTVLLGGILYKGREYHQRIRSDLEPVRKVGDILDGKAPAAPMEQHLGMLLGEVVGDFFFGSFDGSIPAFVQNVMTTDFAQIGGDFVDMTNKVMPLFDGIDCEAKVCGYANEMIDCGGRRVYCEAKGELVQCNPKSVGCAPPEIARVTSAVRSVADKIKSFKTITTGAQTPAAFSNGIFRLDQVLNWVDAQSNWAGWESAAQVVSNFMHNLGYVDFSGCARGQKGVRTDCWDINYSLAQITSVVKQISYPIAKPDPVPIPTRAPPSSGSASTSTDSSASSANKATGSTSSAASGSDSTAAGCLAEVNASATALSFTVTLAAGTNESTMLANVAAKLNIDISVIKVTSSVAGEVTFEFVGPKAGELSAQLECFTKGNGAEALGMGSIRSSPADGSGNSPAGDDNTTIYIIIGCVAGGVVIGVLVGVGIVMSKKKPATSTDGEAAEDTMLHVKEPLNDREPEGDKL